MTYHDDTPITIWSLLLVFFVFLPVLIVAGIAEGIRWISNRLASETGKENCQGWKG